MTLAVPDPPEFGEPLPTKVNEAVLAFLARRRSASALTLRAPGPSASELDILLRLAVRVPDHGKLAPWRFIVLEGAAKTRIGEQLTKLAQARPDATKALAALGKYNAPPLAVCVVSHVKPGDIPEWEQLMSAGAVCITLSNAASAMGYGANWITDWYAFDDLALAAIGVGPDERVAGMVYIGTPAEPPLERVRPDVGLTGDPALARSIRRHALIGQPQASPAGRRSARTHRWECRLWETSSRRCAVASAARRPRRSSCR